MSKRNTGHAKCKKHFHSYTTCTFVCLSSIDTTRHLPISSSTISTNLDTTYSRSKLSYTFSTSQVLGCPPQCLCQVSIARVRQTNLKLHPPANDIVHGVQLSPSIWISRILCQVLSVGIKILMFNSNNLTGVEQLLGPCLGRSCQARRIYQWHIG